MEGFFSLDEVKASQPMQRISGCGACGLHLHCQSPRMEASGKGEKGILIIGECPTVEEDKQGELLTGNAGQLLRRKLRTYGIDMERDCRKINAVCCLTPNGKMPTIQQIDSCRPRIWKEIERFKPHLILLMGEAAIKSFLNHRWKHSLGNQAKEGSKSSGGIVTKWRGWTIPDRDVNAWVVPMFHPSYVLYMNENGGNQIIEKLFDLDLMKAINLLGVDVYKPDVKESTGINVLTDTLQICNVLGNILEHETLIAMDIEATGLKPHATGHQIYSWSMSVSDGKVISFLAPPKGTKAYSLLAKILMSEKIGKIGHNIKFEDNWINILMNIPINNWVWDSMLAAHMLDNREGVTGLKFQTFVQFGVLDYSSHIEQYLKAKKAEGANGLNRIYEAPQKDLLLYGGLDSLFTWQLALQQMKELNYVKN